MVQIRTITSSYCIWVDWAFNSKSQVVIKRILAWPQHTTQASASDILLFTLVERSRCAKYLQQASKIYYHSLQWLRSPQILLYISQLVHFGRAWRPEDIWNSVRNSAISIFKQPFSTHWVRRVNAALVTDAGRLRPLMISRHIFLFITWEKKLKTPWSISYPNGPQNTKNSETNFPPLTSTSPPFSTTSLNSLNKSNVCFAIIGTLLTGVPENKTEKTS